MAASSSTFLIDGTALMAASGTVDNAGCVLLEDNNQERGTLFNGYVEPLLNSDQTLVPQITCWSINLVPRHTG